MEAFLDEADRRIRRFQRQHDVPAFVPSDYPLVYQMLNALMNANLTQGHLMCEWGSGFGVVSCLAAMLEFDVCGIEADDELINASQKLANDFGLPVEFAHGSFIPDGGEQLCHVNDDFDWLNWEVEDGHHVLGLAPDDFQFVFAYPWPDEEELTGQLFDHYAAPGSVLVTYHGEEELLIRKKVE